jgi:hypothetical protein
MCDDTCVEAGASVNTTTDVRAEDTITGGGSDGIFVVEYGVVSFAAVTLALLSASALTCECCLIKIISITTCRALRTWD